jgi:hypothetical protein
MRSSSAPSQLTAGWLRGLLTKHCALIWVKDLEKCWMLALKTIESTHGVSLPLLELPSPAPLLGEKSRNQEAPSHGPYPLRSETKQSEFYENFGFAYHASSVQIVKEILIFLPFIEENWKNIVVAGMHLLILPLFYSEMYKTTLVQCIHPKYLKTTLGKEC